MEYKVEICVDSIESAINAQVAGADRIELCNNLAEGGTTPSYGTIVSARNNLDINIHVLIRPRGSDFLYSDPEYDIMRRDIDVCGECGINGIVTGILNPDGSVDIDRTAKLVEFAYPMSVTFHRAFDMCNDPVRALEDIISTGASRILSSGQKPAAEQGTELLRKMTLLAGDRIIIMPGGGIDETNVAYIVSHTRTSEIHLTGRMIQESMMVFRRNGINMGSVQGLSEFSRKVADQEKIKNIISILKTL